LILALGTCWAKNIPNKGFKLGKRPSRMLAIVYHGVLQAFFIPRRGAISFTALRLDRVNTHMTRRLLAHSTLCPHWINWHRFWTYSQTAYIRVDPSWSPSFRERACISWKILRSSIAVYSLPRTLSLS
jgi:hypothetical protein